ncbi:MAG: hypothetical protein QW478_12900, partial [Candidatus Micrarchaeaceae archaeon]
MVSLVKIIKKYRRAYSNWFSVLYQLYRIRNKVLDETNEFIKVRLRGTDNILNVPSSVVYFYAEVNSIPNPRIHDLSIDNNLLSFFYENYNVKFDLKNTGGLVETFFKDAYQFLKVEGKDVIDIGANIGDTAIYFAIKGARKVISLEPYPYTFAQAIK